MNEHSARKVMSGWSAFRLGMKRPELTVLGVGEWARPSGDKWGIVIRDLRTGAECVVFDTAEWERIKKRGLPPVGHPWGNPLPNHPPLTPQVEHLIETERRLYEAREVIVPSASAGHQKAEQFDAAEAADQFSRRMGRALTTEEYEDAVSDAAGNFVARVKAQFPMSDQQLSVAEAKLQCCT